MSKFYKSCEKTKNHPAEVRKIITVTRNDGEKIKCNVKIKRRNTFEGKENAHTTDIPTITEKVDSDRLKRPLRNISNSAEVQAFNMANSISNDVLNNFRTQPMNYKKCTGK